MLRRNEYRKYTKAGFEKSSVPRQLWEEIMKIYAGAEGNWVEGTRKWALWLQVVFFSKVKCIKYYLSYMYTQNLITPAPPASSTTPR